MTPYTGNAANVTGQTSIVTSTPQDGDSFTAANDNLRTNTLSDWAARFYNQFTLAFTWVAAQTFSLLATFSAGLTSSVGPNTLGGTTALNGTNTLSATTTIGAPTPVNLSLLNGWVSGTSYSGSVAPRYWKDALGIVHLDGAVNGTGKSAATIATLPSSFRPTATYSFSFTNVNSLTTEAAVTVDSSGNIIFQGSGASADFTLAGISFATF